MRILVNGGGIGGLTAALILHHRGHMVRVVEQARPVREVGAGINLQSHGTKVLMDLGLSRELLNNSCQPHEQAYFTRHGALIARVPKGGAAGQTAPQVSVHRGVLHRLLFDACLERIGINGILLGHRGVGYEQSGDSVRLALQEKSSGAEPFVTEEADVLIGADGIHSPLRGMMHPELVDVPPKPSGVHMFRGVTMMPPFLDGKTMILAGNLDLKMVVYPVAECAHSKSLQLINWVAEVAEHLPTMGDAAQHSAHVSYGATVEKAEDVLRHFPSFDLPFLNHAQMVQDARHIFHWPMVDRDPLPHWTDGRVALLGDAAHAMYPIGSNGGSSAIVDAEALGEALDGVAPADAAEALKRYELARLPTCTAVQNACRLMLPERVMDEVEKIVPRGLPVPEKFSERLRVALSMAQKGSSAL